MQIICEFNNQVDIIEESTSLFEKENKKLTELQSLLLAKMGK